MATFDNGKHSRARMPGEVGVWVFILGDMLIFSLFFVVFLFYRREELPVFTASRKHLNQTYGLINTFLMLTSSWFVATAIQAMRRHDSRTGGRLLACAWACGAGFVMIKYLEYSEKIRAGIGLTTNDFFTCYYMFTGIHLFHVLLGMAVLAALISYSKRGPFAVAKLRNLESGAIFWHLVDVLWIVLFALLYLVD